MAKFSETTRLLFLAAMAYVVALGWNTAVKKTFSIYIEKFLKKHSWNIVILPYWIYAIIVTIIVALVTWWVSPQITSSSEDDIIVPSFGDKDKDEVIKIKEKKKTQIK